MDYRLDLFNALKNYQDNMQEHDAVLVICHNHKEGDAFIGISGDQNIISALITNPNGYLKIEENKEKHDKTKRAILNIAVNILNTDETYRNKFKSIIDTLPIDITNES